MTTYTGNPSFGIAELSDWGARGGLLLEAARYDIDALNVFPVPDGDTGTNLLLTWQAATDALVEVGGGPGVGLTTALAALARGALLGARGNSGVIVAQLLRGISESIDSQVTDGRLTSGDTDWGAAIAAALARAADLGYAGVARPVEGTILTVAAVAAQAAQGQARSGVVAVVSAAAEAAADALSHTTEQLPVLAEAGVVDAGGQGLVLLLEALRGVFDPNAPTPQQVLESFSLGRAVPPVAGQLPHALHAVQHNGVGHAAPGDGAFEVMYLLEADDQGATDLRSRLDTMGESVVVVGGGGLWNVHVHTDDAGPAVEAGVGAGRVFRIRITPLDGSASHGAEPPSETGMAQLARRVVVAVASGPALAALFESGGARVVPGGAGRRPTPGAIVDAAMGAAEVLVLPNDDDHQAVADAAAAELRDRGTQVAVLPTHAEVQGLAAVAVHAAYRPFTDDVVAMSAAAAATRFGGLARAEREAMTSAGICHPGDLLGLVEGDIVVLGSDPAAVSCAVADRMLSAGGELVTLVCGDDPFPGRPVADAVRRHLHRHRLDVEVVVYDGGQSHYPLLIGVE